MRVIQQVGYGGPEVLVEKEVDVPTPGEKEVLVRVKGCGVCYRDTLVRRGLMKAKFLPIVPGHELSGEVVEIGEEVEGLTEGDYVTALTYVHPHCTPECRYGEENICKGNKWLGEEIDGCYSDYMVVPYWILKKIEKKPPIPIESFSISTCVLGTIIRGLKTLGKAKLGDTVLITGASGGVGLHAIQIAKAYGLKTIAVTRSEHKAKLIESNGADHVIVAKERFHDEVKRLTDGKGVDIVLENVGGPTLDSSIRSLRKGGTLSLIGNVNPEPQKVLLGLLILKEIKVQGVFNATNKELEEAINLLTYGKITPVITRISLNEEEVRKAHVMLEKGEAKGRIVITP